MRSFERHDRQRAVRGRDGKATDSEGRETGETAELERQEIVGRRDDEAGEARAVAKCVVE